MTDEKYWDAVLINAVLLVRKKKTEENCPPSCFEICARLKELGIKSPEPIIGQPILLEFEI